MSNQTKFHIFPMSFFSKEWRPTSYKMAPGKLENGAQQTKKWFLDKLENRAQCCFSMCDCRLFISKILWKQFAFYLSLSLSVISTSLAQPCCKCSTSRLALRCMRDSTRTGCAWRTRPIYMWRKETIIEWARRMISIVACCHSLKLCTLTARQRWSRSRSARVDSRRSFHFRMEQSRSQYFRFEPEQEPEPILRSVQEQIKIFKRPNFCNDACCCQIELN